MLGLSKVGWVFGHPPREKGYQFSGYEILQTAELQLECANGIEDTPFVTVKFTLDETGTVMCDAFQVTKQSMEMVGEGVISLSEHLGCTKVSPTYTVIVEGREVKEIDNNFFIMNVPIVRYNSDRFKSTFPRVNRDMEVQTRNDLKQQLLECVSEFHFFPFFIEC